MGSAAAGREDKKVEKYSNLSENYHFVAVIIKTYGAYGPQALNIIKKIGKRKYRKQLANVRRGVMRSKTQWVFYSDLD